MKYIIEASEIVYYDIEVEASSADEAKRMVDDGEVVIPEPTDSTDFLILDVRESTDIESRQS